MTHYSSGQHKSEIFLTISVPQERPEDIDIDTFINVKTFFHVKWRGISPEKVDGNLLGYKVFYRNGRGEFSVTVGPHVFEVDIEIGNDPEPYIIEVAGFTRGGLGPRSWPRERSGKLLLTV